MDLIVVCETDYASGSGSLSASRISGVAGNGTEIEKAERKSLSWIVGSKWFQLCSPSSVVSLVRAIVSFADLFVLKACEVALRSPWELRDRVVQGRRIVSRKCPSRSHPPRPSVVWTKVHHQSHPQAF